MNLIVRPYDAALRDTVSPLVFPYLAMKSNRQQLIWFKLIDTKNNTKPIDIIRDI